MNDRELEHKGTVNLQSRRLVLRKFTMKDAAPSFKNWTGDEKVTEYLRWQVHESVDVTRNLISSWIKNYENRDFYQWAIVLKEIHEPIGTISVVSRDDKIAMVHIGYCIGSRWWNRGYTGEALATIIPFFFNKVKVNRIESMHDPHNVGSGKVMQACGLIYEGRLRQADWNNKGIVDACRYAILAEDFRKK